MYDLRLASVLDWRLFKLGSVEVTLGALLSAAVVIAASVVAARLLGRGLDRLRARSRHGGASLLIVEKLVVYAVIAIGVVAGFSALGLNLTSLAVFAGALGVGLGLGLQGVVKEFVSGLVLIFDRALNIGDFVEVDAATKGLVKEIGPRATRLRTNDGVEVLVPNSRLVENPIVNWTSRGQTRRIHVPFACAYGSDKERVRRAVLEAAHALPFTLADDETRKTQVWLVGFGDSALNFELVVWPTPDAVKRPAAMHAAYTWAIDDALRAEGVEIPFPQTDLRVRSLFGREDDAALEALGLNRARPQSDHAPSAPSTAPSGPNDAAAAVMTDRALEDEPPAPQPPST